MQPYLLNYCCLCLLITQNLSRKIWILIIVSMSSFLSFAQLKADLLWTAQQVVHPLQFHLPILLPTLRPLAIYLLNFGNGGTSNDKNAAAIYYEEKNYTVTLTVKDGNQSDTKTATITVYKKPQVSFSVSGPKGCAPFGVIFTSTLYTSVMPLERFFWDFGDGFTDDGTVYF